MGNMKKLPRSLVEKQELQRQETINKVLRATADIKSEGREVTISTLMAYTGLSRSTFAKPHIRELLAKDRYSSGNGAAVTYKRKKTTQEEMIAETDKQIAELRSRNAELEKECERLRGRLFLMMQKQTCKVESFNE